MENTGLDKLYSMEKKMETAIWGYKLYSTIETTERDTWWLPFRAQDGAG